MITLWLPLTRYDSSRLMRKKLIVFWSYWKKVTLYVIVSCWLYTGGMGLFFTLSSQCINTYSQYSTEESWSLFPVSQRMFVEVRGPLDWTRRKRGSWTPVTGGFSVMALGHCYSESSCNAEADHMRGCTLRLGLGSHRPKGSVPQITKRPLWPRSTNTNNSGSTQRDKDRFNIRHHGSC